ncbi:MAG: bacterial Ig-like domain-containing protein [Oscillospiraceae bacterium]|nr:bacterial Ig-like domain-containing protein [Oscillospiraceae bacterium]
MKKPLLTVLLFLCAIFLCCTACGTDDTTDAVELTALKITQAPAKTAYTAGERFETTGMIVMGVYSDGSETEITAYTLDKTALAEGDTEVTVSYKGLSITQAVTVSADTPVSSNSGNPGSENTSGNPGGDEPTVQFDTVTLVNAPVRLTYVAGEKFDPTGILLRTTKGTEETLVTACTCPDTALSADTTTVPVTCGGVTVDVPVTVVAGSPMEWSNVHYSHSTVDSLIHELKSDNQTQSGIDIGLVYKGEVLNNLLPHTYAAGVASFEELLEEVDYHLFYGRSSMVIKVNYDLDNLEETLDRLYFGSGFAGGCMSIQGQALADGYVQIIVKYYSETLMSVTPTAVVPTYLEFAHTESTRDADYTFSTIDPENGIAVYNSEQAVWALTHGYSIAPVKGSPVETVLERAKEILVSCCDDTMTPFQKMYNVYYYIQSHVTYDFAGEVWAGSSPDPANESDMLSSMLISFRAEGALLYGNAACYGYAKGITLLLGLEGLDITRVVSMNEDVVGRSQNEYDSDSNAYTESIGTHSYSYVRLDGSDYLIDGTYAFAGTPPIHGESCTLYRDFCVGYSKERHAKTYVQLQGDRYCESPDYHPADFDTELLGSYDGGAHDCLLESKEEVTAYLTALAAKATQRDAYYAFSITVTTDCYSDLSDFEETIISQFTTAFDSDEFMRFSSVRKVNGLECYTMPVVIYLP